MSIYRHVVFIALFIILSFPNITNAGQPELSESNDVQIAPNAIGIPLKHILLIRKGNDYCAVRFTQCWTGKTKYDQHAEYESYYQEDKSGDFDRANVKFRNEEIYYTKPSFSIFGHPVMIGAKRDIRCGPIELWWSGISCQMFVYYNKHDQYQKDYGFELAPTPWTAIKGINVKDPRIKWFRFDENRKDKIIPIDKLWK